MNPNPWVASYQIGEGPSRYSVLERRASPVEIKGGSHAARAQVLRSSMQEIFLCGIQCSAIMDQLLSLGESHAITKCSSAQHVLQGIYSVSPWGETGQPAVMLTGLAGTGKTQLILAMKRLLEMRAGVVDLPAHRNLTLRPGWFMSLKNGNTLNALLSPLVQDESLPTQSTGVKKALNQTRLLEIARRVSRREGTCILVIDEFQFITRSLQANTLAMSLLLQLLSIGPRLVYVANFSLVRRLLSRRQEDRQRVLSNHLELLPDRADSLDFENYARELTRVLPSDWSSEVCNSHELLHRYTFGIKRALVELLVIAWLHSKTQRGDGAKVNTEDLKSAYVSAGYTPFRFDVEALWRHSVGQKDINPDLLNPLYPCTPVAKVVVAQAAIDSFNQRVNERHLENMLTPAEQEAFSKLNQPTQVDKTATKTIRLPAKFADKASLLDAFSKLHGDCSSK